MCHQLRPFHQTPDLYAYLPPPSLQTSKKHLEVNHIHNRTPNLPKVFPVLINVNLILPATQASFLLSPFVSNPSENSITCTFKIHQESHCLPPAHLLPCQPLLCLTWIITAVSSQDSLCPPLPFVTAQSGHSSQNSSF